MVGTHTGRFIGTSGGRTYIHCFISSSATTRCSSGYTHEINSDVLDNYYFDDVYTATANALIWNFTTIWNALSEGNGTAFPTLRQRNPCSIFSSNCVNTIHFCYITNGSSSSLDGTCQNGNLFLIEPKKGYCFCDDTDRGKPTGIYNTSRCSRMGSNSGHRHYIGFDGKFFDFLIRSNGGIYAILHDDVERGINQK